MHDWVRFFVWIGTCLEESSVFKLVFECKHQTLLVKFVLDRIIFKSFVDARFKIISKRLKWWLKIIAVSNFSSVLFVKSVVVCKQIREIIVVFFEILIGESWGKNNFRLHLHEFFANLRVNFSEHRETFRVTYKCIHLKLECEDFFTEKTH